MTAAKGAYAGSLRDTGNNPDEAPIARNAVAEAPSPAAAPEHLAYQQSGAVHENDGRGEQEEAA